MTFRSLDLSTKRIGSSIECVKETVFFGEIVDEPHILNASRKISKSKGVTKTLLRSLYYSLVYPYLMLLLKIM